MDFSRAYLDRLSREELVELLMQKKETGSLQPLSNDIFETYIREIINVSPDALLILSRENMRLIACNQPSLRLLELDTHSQFEAYLQNLFQERPLFYDLLLELSSTFSNDPDVSMEVEFDTSGKQQRFGDLVVRKVKVLGQELLMLRIIDITEVKQAQMQVLDSERQLEMAQEIAQIGSYIFFQNERRFQFSRAFYHLLELDADDSKPQSSNELLSYVLEEDRPNIDQILKKIYSNKEDAAVEFRITTKKENLKHLYCKVKVERDSYGQISKLMGTVQDITDRVKTENRLRESEELYRLTVENTNDSVWYWNFRSMEGFMSPKFEKTLGLPDEVITSETLEKWFDKVHPDERQAYRERYEACVRGNIDAFRMEFRYRMQNDEYMWVESGAALIRDDQQQPHYLLGTIREIQDRKQVEIQLKEQERFLKMAQSVAHVGSWIWDREPDTLQFSEELYRIMELDTSLQGKPLGDEVIRLVVDEDKEMVNRFLSESNQMKDGKQHVIEGRIRVASGIIKVLRTTAQVYSRNSRGDVAQLIGTMQDITEDKRREQELVDAKEQAEISQRAKDRFLQIVSHEIRNPLNAIVGITRLLEQSELAQTHREQLSTLGFSSQHLLSIINDILDTAKLQYGNIKLDRVPFSLKDQLHQIEELFKPLAADQQNQLVSEIDKHLPELVSGDPTRFNQVIFNLLSNAVKYTYRGKISLKARLIKKQHESVLLEFEISDTGTGIPADKMDKVFEAFEQFDLPENQQKGGTGLGLYIVQELLSLMDGTIEVRSEFGRGTTFTITLAFDEATQENHENGKSNLQGADLSDCRMLYVEDAHYNQLLLKGYAQVWNLQLDLASDIQEALQWADNESYDIILTDYRLPDGTGEDLAHALERMKIRKKIPLIVISAYQLEDSLEQYVFDDYIQKPINFDKFFYVLRKYLRKQVVGPKEKETPVENHDNALEYLEKNQPGQFLTIMNNLLEELPDFQEQIQQSIDTQNYRLYLLTVHKLSSALRMIQEHDILDYLHHIEDLPESEAGKIKVKKKIESGFSEIYKKCKDLKVLGKTS